MIECIVEGCGEIYGPVSRGMCRKHYCRWLRNGHTDRVNIDKRNTSVKCNIEDCDTEYYARGMCERHYQSWRKYGDPLRASRIAPATSYSGIHQRLVYYYGSPQQCDYCGTTSHIARYEWALRHEDTIDIRRESRFDSWSGYYSSVEWSPYLKDYWRLCDSCHRSYDGHVHPSCSVEECDNAAIAHGLCPRHYEQTEREWRKVYKQRTEVEQ